MKESMQHTMRVQMQMILLKSMFAVLKTGICVENRRKLIKAKSQDFLKLNLMCTTTIPKKGDFV